MTTTPGSDPLFVLAAPYDSVAAASEDYDALASLYARSGSTHALDAAVVERDADGQVLVAEERAEVGLAIAVAAALFPAIGVGAALALGAGGGPAMGALVGHVHADIPREELQQLGEMLEAAAAGLIVVYDESVARQVEATVRSPSCSIVRASAADVAQLVREAGTVTDPALTKP